MNKHKNIIVLIIIIIFCSNRIATSSQNVYYGLTFDYNISLTIFNVLSFCCMSNFLRMGLSSVFSKNIIKLIKNNNRKTALAFELVQKTKKMILFLLINFSSIYIFESLHNDINIYRFFVYCFLNILTSSLLMLIQFYFELFISIDFGIYFINFIYISGILSGQFLYWYSLSHSDILGTVALYFNKINILNYLSINRIEALNLDKITIIIFLSILIIGLLALLNKKIVKKDIL